MPGELRVVATAGHVDHGKSSLIVRLTGIDPDRWDEEKRRGLTIDLGYAWCTLPGGREVGFVDVPGHERFIRNMLAGVGPVRLVLFVVAADEGWKPQSEEHLQILDVLGLTGGVIALTKCDLVDNDILELAHGEVQEHVAGTALSDAPVIPVSSRTGEGIGRLRDALDTMVAAAPEPPDARTRLFVDRVFSIKGAGTVVTGTLTGGCLELGDDVAVAPSGSRARIRSLQTHKRSENRACPVSRVAMNLVGVEREQLERGDVVTVPGAWRPTAEFDVVLRTVRGLDHPITSRGAFKVHAGAAETDARLRLLSGGRLEAGAEAFARIRTTRPLVLDVFDRFVLRDAGRRRTVGGGVVLDVAPALGNAAARVQALVRRAGAERQELARLTVQERGAIRTQDVPRLVGSEVAVEDRLREWAVTPALRDEVRVAVEAQLNAFHRAHPLDEGAGLTPVRRAVVEVLRHAGAPSEPDLAEALLTHLSDSGDLVRSAGTVRLASHKVALDECADELEGLRRAIGGAHETMPPTVGELQAAGFGRDVIEASARAGVIVRISPDLVLSPDIVARAEELVRAAGAAGITVSAIREQLGTTRKYAVPLMEWLDHQGVTRREGDLRFPRDPA